MEEVFTVYQRPYDARFPVIGLDEGCKQLLGSEYEDVAMQPDQPHKEDDE
jgi:hypothetical protein